MRVRYAALAACATLVAVATAFPVVAQAAAPLPEVPLADAVAPQDDPAYTSDEVLREAQSKPKSAEPSLSVIVSFDTDATKTQPTRDQVKASRADVLSNLPPDGYDVVSSFSRIPAVSLTVDVTTLEELRQDPRVTAINADEVVHTMMTEANALTGVGAVHTAGITGAGVTVAVVDTGIDSDHPALADDLVGQACFRAEGDCPAGVTSAEDENGHGTHVSGIITGPEGVAPDAGIYAIKVFRAGTTSTTNILNGLNHVIALNTAVPGTIDVVNLSLGTGDYGTQASCDRSSAGYVSAFRALNAQGVSVFAATGNGASTASVSSPGCVSGAIGVGSVGDGGFDKSFSVCHDVGAADKVSCFSNTTPVQGPGELVDLLAPGCSIDSTGLAGSTNFTECGTSMSSPYAAGAAALLLQKLGSTGTTMTPAEVETHMEETGVPVTDYRIGDNTLWFPRVSPPAMIGTLDLERPKNLAITAMNSSSATLTWDATPGADEYFIYASVNGSPATKVNVDPVTTNSWIDTATACGSLTYYVRAAVSTPLNGTLQSLPSNTARGVSRSCPVPPSGLNLTVTGDRSHTLAWSDSNPNETSFAIQSSQNGSEFTDTVIRDPGTAGSYAFNDVACGSWRYRVVAVRGSDRSPPSNDVTRNLCLPENDDFASAEIVQADTPTIDTEPNQSHATEEPTDPTYSCRFGGEAGGFQGVWYDITPLTDTRVTVSTVGTNLTAAPQTPPDTLVSILTGAPGHLGELACNDDISTADLRSSVSANLEAGTTYYVFVSQWTRVPAGTAGDLVTSFTWSAPQLPPANDLIQGATTITAPTFSGVADNAHLATNSATDPVHACRITGPAAGTHTTWWTFTPTTTGLLDVSTLGSSGSFADTVMSVYTGAEGDLTSVACNDDINELSISQSRITDLPVDAGTTYFVEVSRWSQTPTVAPGTVLMNAEFTPPPGVAVSASSVAVNEDGGTDTYTLALKSAPAADVTIGLVTGADCDAQPRELTFTSANFSTPQTVTVSATTDANDAEGVQVCPIDHIASSADAGYNAISITGVTAEVTDKVVTFVTLITPAETEIYSPGQVVNADFACSDNQGGVGLVACTGTVENGTPIDTTSGTHSFSVTATDVYGRLNVVTHNYEVAAAVPDARPDARIQIGSAGRLFGDDIYDTLVGQSRSTLLAAGRTVTYYASMQNDASTEDRLRLAGMGSANRYGLSYYADGVDISSEINDGTFVTPVLVPGAAYTIQIKVTVGVNAAAGSSLIGDLTASSVASPAVTDAVRFTTGRS